MTCTRGHQHGESQCPSCARRWQRERAILTGARATGAWGHPLPPRTRDVLRWETFKATVVHRIEMARFEDRVAERRRAS